MDSNTSAIDGGDNSSSRTTEKKVVKVPLASRFDIDTDESAFTTSGSKSNKSGKKHEISTRSSPTVQFSEKNESVISNGVSPNLNSSTESPTRDGGSSPRRLENDTEDETKKTKKLSAKKGRRKYALLAVTKIQQQTRKKA